VPRRKSWFSLECNDYMELHMPHIISHYLPELDEPERSFIERLTAEMSHDNIQQFAAAYRQVRKDPQTLRLMAIIGIVAIPGLHRFWVGQISIGFLYLLSYGLLLIGTVTDIVKYKELAFTYNRQVATRIAKNLAPPRKASSIEAETFFDRSLSRRQHSI
jgi:TM2 domain-containing membrane protein YozV